jgi:hypothetical protein
MPARTGGPPLLGERIAKIVVPGALNDYLARADI